MEDDSPSSPSVGFCLSLDGRPPCRPPLLLLPDTSPLGPASRWVLFLFLAPFPSILPGLTNAEPCPEDVLVPLKFSFALWSISFRTVVHFLPSFVCFGPWHLRGFPRRLVARGCLFRHRARG